tara:strand:- start:77 stop:325 length:249 start_codon:yes stop_codon:yes gene_type:complete
MAELVELVVEELATVNHRQMVRLVYPEILLQQGLLQTKVAVVQAETVPPPLERLVQMVQQEVAEILALAQPLGQRVERLVEL